MNLAFLLTLLLMGLTGGLHCAAMCGGLVVASERAMQQPLLPARALFRGALQLQLARVAGYALLGTAAGAIGSGLWTVSARPLQLGLYAAGNLVLGFSGLWLLRSALGWPRALPQLSGRLGGAGLRQRATAAGMRVLDRLLPLHSVARRIGAGLLWGMLPCGLVYSALSLALLSGSAWRGAAAMAAFGIGTLPHMLLAGHLLRRFSQRMTGVGARLLAAAVLLGFAGWGLWRLLGAGAAFGAHGYCVT